MAPRRDRLSLRLPSRKSPRNWAPRRHHVNRYPTAALRSHKNIARPGAHPPERPLVMCSPLQTRDVDPRHLDPSLRTWLYLHTMRMEMRTMRECTRHNGPPKSLPYDTPCHPRQHNGPRPRRVLRPGVLMYTTCPVHPNFSTMIRKRQSRPMVAR